MKMTQTQTLLPTVQLARAQPSKFPHVNQIGEATPPAFNGTVDDFVQSFSQTMDAASFKTLQQQTKNKVKKCTSCGKPCAFTLAHCNGCGCELSSVPISFTNNVFTGFIYGIHKGPFPFFISLRRQTPSILIFDDLLQLTTCHLNCIPTNVYIPDLRCLFENPVRGHALLLQMKQQTWEVALEQYLGNTEWRSKLLQDSASLTDDALATHVCAGLNYPPSQYQLHLQFMLPPFTPFHWNLYNGGGHFTLRRFFPIEYMLDALNAMGTSAIQNASSMDIDALIELVQQRYGVDYDAIHKACYDRYGASHRRLSNWSADDFDGIVSEDGKRVVARRMNSHSSSSDGERKEDVQPLSASDDAKIVANEDKLVLQNYGRPYSETGRPTGTYYKHAKTPPLPLWA
jgi:hypothetical protein